MRKAAIVLLLLIIEFSLHAQCPDRAAIMKRITVLKNSFVRPADQLKELSGNIPAFEKCPANNDSVFSNLLQRVGALEYAIGDTRQAVFWTARSLAAERSHHTARPAFLVKVYDYLQIFYDSLSQSSQKMEAIDSCIAVAVRTNLIYDRVLYNLLQRVDYSFDVGDYRRCADYAHLGESITVYCDNTQDSIMYLLNFFTQHVNALINLRQFDDAEKMLKAKIFQYIVDGNEKNCGALYNQLSEISTQRIQYPEAIAYLTKSLKCNQQNGYRLGCKQTYNNIGYQYLSGLNDYATALKYFYLSLKYKNDVKINTVADAIETFNIYGNIANAYARIKKFDSSDLYFKKAFDQLRPGIDERSIPDFSADEFLAGKKMQYLTGLIKDKGDAYFLKYVSGGGTNYISNAISTYKIADQVLTRVKAEQSEASSGLAWRANARSLYESAIDACYAVRDPATAFYFFEKSRAVLLRDEINAHRHSSDDEIKQQVQLKRKLRSLKEKLSKAVPASSQYQSLQREIVSSLQESDVVSRLIQKRDPVYYHNYIDTTFISMSSLKKNILKSDKSLMEIFYGDSAVYVLFVSVKEQEIKKINKIEYDALTGQFVKYISDPALLNRHYNVFIPVAHKLFSLLFDNISKNSDRLIISPDGQYFPFESLAATDKEDAPGFVIYDHAVSYTYSAGYLLNESVNVDSAGYFMGMAPVNFASVTGLPPLPSSDKSLHAISSLFNLPKECIYAKATRSIFLDNFSRYRILQLYTHASGGGAEAEPEIYFSDSSLKLSDIDPVYGSATRLVVLSACETGNGAYYKGEGVFSFNRTFASIGIPSSMVNLWSVDNQAVYKLTELFYKYIAQGLPLDISLQRAKIDFIHESSKDRSMPYYWAAPVIVGKSDAVLPVSTGYSRTLLWSVPILFITAFLFYKGIVTWKQRRV